MTSTDYTLQTLAKQRLDASAERRGKHPRGFPRPRRRHAMAEQFRRIADAIDN